jgi:hypothetical protein
MQLDILKIFTCLIRLNSLLRFCNVRYKYDMTIINIFCDTQHLLFWFYFYLLRVLGLLACSGEVVSFTAVSSFWFSIDLVGRGEWSGYVVLNDHVLA